MTDPRRLNCEAAANVVALVNAHHHELDEASADLIASLSETELALTLIAAIDGLTHQYEVEAVELRLSFDDYLRPLGAAVGRRRV